MLITHTSCWFLLIWPLLPTYSDQQEREIIRVLIDCAGQEAAYNPFYAYLAGRLCEYHDKYKFTLQLTFWDMYVQTFF